GSSLKRRTPIVRIRLCEGRARPLPRAFLQATGAAARAVGGLCATQAAGGSAPRSHRRWSVGAHSRLVDSARAAGRALERGAAQGDKGVDVAVARRSGP